MFSATPTRHLRTDAKAPVGQFPYLLSSSAELRAEHDELIALDQPVVVLSEPHEQVILHEIEDPHDVLPGAGPMKGVGPVVVF